MKRGVLAVFLFAVCANVRFVDESQHTARAWVCIPETDGDGLRCIDKALYNQMWLEEAEKQRRERGGT